MTDFEIEILNGGEVAVRALSDRAHKERRVKIGHAVVFKSSAEAKEYVVAAENEGMTFSGKQFLQI